MTTKEKFIEMAKNITRPGIDEMMAAVPLLQIMAESALRAASRPIR